MRRALAEMEEVEDPSNVTQWSIPHIEEKEGKYIIDKLEKNMYIRMYGDVCDKLMFNEGAKLINGSKSLESKPKREGHSLHYVYCNCIEQQYVGDSYTKLLGVIRAETYKSQHVVYNNPTYLAVPEDDLEWIQITIKDEADNRVQFDNSPEKSLIKLHFRPRHYGF
jgi:hypothetical protein